MPFAIFTFVLQVVCLWSIYKLIWQFDKSKKYFAWLQLLIISVCGFLSFCIMFLMALGSTGHFVVSDFEELMGDVTMYLGIFGSFTSFIGVIIAIVKGIKSRKYGQLSK